MKTTEVYGLENVLNANPGYPAKIKQMQVFRENSEDEELLGTCPNLQEMEMQEKNASRLVSCDDIECDNCE